jgi:EAL domain-containing protein (putative c-di-GMP-specific phosphodiesterase class I)
MCQWPTCGPRWWPVKVPTSRDGLSLRGAASWAVAGFAHPVALAFGGWQARHAGLQALGVAVNIGGRELGPALIAAVRRCLRSNELDPGCLTLEITEGVIQADAALDSDALRRLKDLGVWLAIDDLGTGPSSLARLRDYAFDELKIDRQFVRDLEVGDTRFVAAQIALAHALGMKVVAEGVETSTQLRLLRDQGCGQVQGFLLGKPMPAVQIRAVLAGDGPVPQAGEGHAERSSLARRAGR